MSPLATKPIQISRTKLGNIELESPAGDESCTMGQILRILCPDLPWGMWGRYTVGRLLDDVSVSLPKRQEIIERLNTVANNVYGSSWNEQDQTVWSREEAEAMAVEDMKSIGFEIEFVD